MEPQLALPDVLRHVPLPEWPRVEFHGLLNRLAFHAEDVDALLSGLVRLSDRDRRRVQELRRHLATRVGRLTERVNVLEDEFSPSHPGGQGYLNLLALTSVAPLVQAEFVRRGLDTETAWRSVSDLGQQVHIHRVVHGEFGFSSAEWVSLNYNASLVWLGRLQYSVEYDHHWGWVLGCHIPESGPLSPHDVEDSLRRLHTEMIPAFPEFEFSRVTCRSWLLDQNLVARLHPDSNVAQFARRFVPYGDPTPGRRDALFFGFHIESHGRSPVDHTILSAKTSLQRAIVAQLDDGDVVVQPGWLEIPHH